MMKTIMITLLLFVFQSAIGQAIDSILIQTDWSDTTKKETIEGFLEKYYEEVDFGYMETDYFYGQVISYSDIARYGGDTLDTLVTKQTFRQIYHEMHAAQKGSNTMVEIHQLEEQLQQYVLDNNAIPMVVIDLDFEEFDLESVDNGFLEMRTVGEGIKTTGNGSPFIKRHVFVSFPYWGVVNEDFPVVFNSDFFISNSSDAELDFQSLELITNGKNSTLETIYKSDLAIATVVKTDNYNTIFSYGRHLKSGFVCNIDDPDHTETSINDCELGIYYGCRHEVTGGVRNPVLIVEGFDPNNNRHLTCQEIINDTGTDDDEKKSGV